MTLPIYGPPDTGDIGGLPPQVQTPFPVTSVQGPAGPPKTGAVTITLADLGIPNVNNTADANKPVSTPQASAIAAVQSGVDAHTAHLLVLDANVLLD